MSDDSPEPRFERANPFRPGSLPVSAGRTNPTKSVLLRKVSQLKLDPNVLRLASDKVRELTVKDLNDLASEFSGVATENSRLQGLSLDDIRNIEEVFTEFKLDSVERMINEGLRPGADLASVDVSCCCCTPCCCCAAAETDPFAA